MTQMCTTHSHGPNTVATSPHLIGANQYLNSPSSGLLATTSQNILQSVLSLKPFSDAERTTFNNISSKEGKIVFLADHMSTYYTAQASIAYARGDTKTGDTLMEEMKNTIAQIHNGVL